MKEIWKDIEGYKGYYQVSNLGRVKSLKRIIKDKRGGIRTIRKRILASCINGRGYLVVVLSKGCINKMMRVHQLVAIVFLNHTPCGMKLVVNHIDFNKTNNHLYNLEVVTHRENANRKHLKSTSKYTGVSSSRRKKKKWRADIKIDGNQKYLGSFISEIEASNTYQKELNKINTT